MNIVSDKNENSIGHAANSFSPRSGLSFIEQLQISSNGKCTKDNRPYLNGVNENAKIALLTRPACKMWDCETCALRNAKTWIAKVINGVNKLGGEWSFLTVTAHKAMRGERSIRSIREGWKKLYNRILSKFDKSATTIYYCKVWEQHEDGSFHLHILFNVCLGTRWAKDNCAECGLGYQAKWTKISNAGKVAGYMAKYSLKNASMARNGISWPKGLRRIETSHKWPVLPKLKGSDEIQWIIKMTRDAQLISANAYHLRGFEILDKTGEMDA